MVALDAANYVYVAMNCDGKLRVATSRVGGGSFSVPNDVGIDAAEAVVVLGGQHYEAFVFARLGDDILMSKTSDAGASWSSPVTISGSSESPSASSSLSGYIHEGNVFISAKTGSSEISIYALPGGDSGSVVRRPHAFASESHELMADGTGKTYLATTSPYAVRTSTDGGIGFSSASTANASSSAASDWALSGSRLWFSGDTSNQVYRVATTSLTGADSIAVGTSSPAQRSMAAGKNGNGYIVESLTNSGQLQARRALPNGTTASAETLDPAGLHPHAVSRPDLDAFVVAYESDTNEVSVRVKFYGL